MNGGSKGMDAHKHEPQAAFQISSAQCSFRWLNELQKNDERHLRISRTLSGSWQEGTHCKRIVLVLFNILELCYLYPTCEF
jgi:hypothetical protein